MTKKNKIIVPEARMALDQMKAEIANELGLTDNMMKSNGETSSRQNGNVGGSIGGNMTKRLIEQAQRDLVNRDFPL